MQNKISLMQMTCAYLWVRFFFFFFLHSTHMFNTDEKSGQRFILKAPNHNPFLFKEHFFSLILDCHACDSVQAFYITLVVWHFVNKGFVASTTSLATNHLLSKTSLSSNSTTTSKQYVFLLLMAWFLLTTIRHHPFLFIHNNKPSSSSQKQWSRTTWKKRNDKQTA
jgi:hypothetical protein